MTRLLLCLAASVFALPAVAQPSQESLNATGQLLVDTIKQNCRKEHPTDEARFVGCATTRYDAMVRFLGKLYSYRDTKGVNSTEFRKGVECIDIASPSVVEFGRKKAMEHADWVKADDCYSASLRR